MGRPSSLYERILITLVREGQWEIDEHGRVWCVADRRGLRAGGSHLVPCKRKRIEHRTPEGYLQVRAMIEGRRMHCGAHRLVWQHLHGDIPPGHEINHRNGLKDDNRPGNLLCGTAGENVEHAHHGGLIDQHGQKNPAAKLTDNQVAQIRLAYSQGGHTMEALAQRFNVTFQTISKIVRGQRRQKQGGPVAGSDQRHAAGPRASSGRFTRREEQS
ncbi:HNH endonuclease [Methylorubrum rhodesianum]|uniref:HNH endonuclease n=1 Tax=Methylorubrum rhodesianum TaxID=29427 RepID=UPI00161516A4|nr:HNH endonuclease [Methylorubrum rhodesianum]MBB5764642.1 hypothetical protein [Methylorubrum rhodesianum]